jgi:hypothetical protein
MFVAGAGFAAGGFAVVKVVLATRQQGGVPGPLPAAHLDKPAAFQCTGGPLMTLIRPYFTCTSTGDPLTDGNLARCQPVMRHPPFS